MKAWTKLEKMRLRFEGLWPRCDGERRDGGHHRLRKLM